MTITKVSFTNGQGEKLAGDLYLPEGDLGAGVVFGHCFSCSRHTRILIESCEALYQRGIASLRFDFSGNGQSEGDFSETTYSKHVAEMKAGIGLMRQHGIEKIGLAGHSMGAAIALLTADTVAEVSGVCTLAGRYSSMNFDRLLDAAARSELEENGKVCFTSRNRSLCLSADFLSDAESYDLSGITRGLSIPILAVHGDRDEIIPVDEVYKSQELKPAQTEIFVVEGADHMFSNGEHRAAIADHLTRWFMDQMGVNT